MQIFQKSYDFFKKLTAPAWMKALIQELNDILVSILIQVSKDYKDFIIEKIMEATHMSIPNDKKFKYVVDEAKKGFVTFGIVLKDTEINSLVQFIYNKLKKDPIV